MRLWHILAFDFLMTVIVGIALNLYYVRKIRRQAINKANNKYIVFNLMFDAEARFGFSTKNQQYPIDDRDWEMFEKERANRQVAMFRVFVAFVILFLIEGWIVNSFLLHKAI